MQTMQVHRENLTFPCWKREVVPMTDCMRAMGEIAMLHTHPTNNLIQVTQNHLQNANDTSTIRIQNSSLKDSGNFSTSLIRHKRQAGVCIKHS